MDRNKICGVYKITNIINGNFYIGASVDIRGMYSIHLNRHVGKFKDSHNFYKEIYEYGKENFELEILKLCDRSELLINEQYYYDILNPSYNKVRPAIHNFIHEDVRKLASKNSNDEFHVKARIDKYNTEEYTHIFRKEIHKDIMRAVRMYSDESLIMEFDSIRDAGRWIRENTDYSAKSSQSKIKEVCDGKRKSAYGYNWKYNNV